MTSSTSVQDSEDSFEVVDGASKDAQRDAELEQTIEQQQTTINRLKEEVAKTAPVIAKLEREKKDTEKFNRRLEKLKELELVKGWNVASLFRCCVVGDIAVSLVYFGYSLGDVHSVSDFVRIALISAVTLAVDMYVLHTFKRRMDAGPSAYFFSIVVRLFFALKNPWNPVASYTSFFLIQAYVQPQLAISCCCLFLFENIHKHLKQQTKKDAKRAKEEHESYYKCIRNPAWERRKYGNWLVRYNPASKFCKSD